MPISFARLRIAGFKSFAEPATVEILPGLTGVVGPNGCGKSNVVEALRWAMGENSARSLRGGEMEDVIFAGSTARASRNIAEVTLSLDEAQGRAPPPFHEHAELQVSRRIERGMGSTFRVNGREVRARDVQTLFADLASGAHSSAMVSQGRVGAVVTARPESRRAILEEAAGITGLHARRHEAELKLRAAEANLSRAEDLRGQLEQQLAGLKRQARQASRYRNISGAIRQAEMELFAVQRARAEQARAAAGQALHEARAGVATATEAATAAGAAATEAAAALPPLRESEAAARTALERHRLAREQIEADAERARSALDAARQRLARLAGDLAHAEQLERDAAAAERRLADEDMGLAAAAAEHQARAEIAVAEADQAGAAAHEAETAANRATEAAAEAGARVQSVAQLLAPAEQRAKRLADQQVRLTEERARIVQHMIDPARVATAGEEQDRAEAAVGQAREALEAAEQARVAAEAALAAARERQSAAEPHQARLAAEARALAEILAVKDGERWPPMVDALGVPPGLEAALGAVLGEELTSAADGTAARHWRELPPLALDATLPCGAVALAGLVEAPAALDRALAQIGLVEDEATGETHQGSLAPGQALVSRAGAVWRWDGYTVRSGTPTEAAVRLQQRNRLTALRAGLAEATRQAEAARRARETADAASRQASAAEAPARAARREAERRVEGARAAAAQLRNQAATATARLQAVEAQIALLRLEAEEAAAALAGAREAHAALPDVGALRSTVAAARAALSATRANEAKARTARDTLEVEHQARLRRRSTIAAERSDWGTRARDADGRVADLAARRAEAEAERADLDAAPAQFAVRQAEAIERMEAAETCHRQAAATLAFAVARQEQADRAARATELALAAAREGVVRADAAAEQAARDWGVVAERIVERLGASPALPDAPAEPSADTEEKARRRHERLLREREEMGPVNLRAEIESEAVEKQVAAIAAERDELSAAIAKLRGSIGHLNREGRERLSAVFQEVDRHFQALFARMFGGGRAYLGFVGSDDPLQAGLEIYAQPPGKKLATLSLLSGGEQALTALSLIFAVFRCNPAPICVLDEVDAPLDDANVARFCALLDDMVRETGTRFLVVTHHHLTMARMDRLYGVTMQERGVSRLLSVDLRKAGELVDPPRMAAE